MASSTKKSKITPQTREKECPDDFKAI